ncbi:hypothetical protein PR048_016589 [Dryococelus australis]|uniref:Uncharacterized protein n=1 Tax=Dryococelus australis TaxID=614101 RepID=A0ABQ9H751_9NEOP|nr:hypothetical protein PR048_016589 [Dryococelus australis]
MEIVRDIPRTCWKSLHFHGSKTCYLTSHFSWIMFLFTGPKPLRPLWTMLDWLRKAQPLATKSSVIAHPLDISYGAL